MNPQITLNPEHHENNKELENIIIMTFTLGTTVLPGTAGVLFSLKYESRIVAQKNKFDPCYLVIRS